jgi:hypothetical protein
MTTRKKEDASVKPNAVTAKETTSPTIRNVQPGKKP